jgi:putative effector of murein hydrolase LrgA (UPF0299 family)
MLKAFLITTGVLFWIMVQIGIAFALVLLVTALGVRKYCDWEEKKGKYDIRNSPRL